MPRAGLTPARVVAEAAAVADEVGFERLTLAAVAARVGVALPSLYKHVRGLDGLRRGVALLGTRELAAELSTAAAGRTTADALHSMSHAYRDYARRRPGVVAASVIAPEPEDAEHVEAAEQVLTVLAAALSGYHLSEPDRIDAIRSFRAALHGFTTLEAAGGFRIPQSVDDSFDRLIDALHLAFTSWGATA